MSLLGAEVPGEPATLTGVMAELAGRGFAEQFRVVDGRLRVMSSGAEFAAAQVVVAAYYRFEGVSDPDDMAILYAIETRTGVRGTIADAFGVYADPLIGAFMEAVALCRSLERPGAADGA
jgi:hypothetical protein